MRYVFFFFFFLLFCFGTHPRITPPPHAYTTSTSISLLVDHNMELALSWLESQRIVMTNSSLAHYFLQYNYSSGGNGVIFNAPRAEGNQYFWNYLQNDAAQYYISSVVGSLADNATDGTCACEGCAARLAESTPPILPSPLTSSRAASPPLPLFSSHPL